MTTRVVSEVCSAEMLVMAALSYVAAEQNIERHNAQGVQPKQMPALTFFDRTEAAMGCEAQCNKCVVQSQ